MDELIGLFFFAMLAVAAVTVYLAICVAIAGAATAAFGVESMAVGLRGFGVTLGRGIRFRAGDRAKPSETEPAYQAYLLGPFGRDFAYALGVGLDHLNEKRRHLFDKAGDYLQKNTWPLGVGAGIGAVLGYGLALVVAVAVAIPVGVIVIVASTFSWIAANTLYLLEKARMRLRRAHYECPEDHERFPLPTYVCPACGAKHRKLLPGRHGILHRVCECDRAALPTLQLNGRNKLPMECPDGHSMSGAIGIAQNVPIPLAGGPSAGKSSYLAAAMIELERLGAEGSLALSVVEESRSGFDALTSALRGGIRPAKTADEQAPALVAEVGDDGHPRILYAYDVAGEVYDSADKVKGMAFLARSAGLILLIDPLAIPRVAEEHADEIAPLTDALRPSSEDPLRVFERVLGTLRESGAGDLGKLPLAVVIAKADAIGIEAEIAAGTGAESAPKAWLEQNGAGNLVRAIDLEFKRVNWFACSALGRTPVEGDNRPYEPRGVLEPMLWLLEQNGVSPKPSTNGKPRETVTARYEAEAAVATLVGAKRREPRPSEDIAIPPSSWSLWP